MRRFLSILFLPLFLAGGVPDIPEDDMPLVTLPLQTSIGNALLGDVKGPWSPWVNDDDDFILPEDFWFVQLLGTPDINERGGYLMIPEHATSGSSEDFPNGLSWLMRVESKDAFSLYDTELYFRWQPVTSDLVWLTRIQIFDEVDGVFAWVEIGSDDPEPFILAEIFGNTSSAFGNADYDPVTHRWLRIKHDAATDVLSFSTAPPGGTWSVMASLDMDGDSVRNFKIEMLGQAFTNADNPSTPGWWGPWNPGPETHDLPLFTTVGDIPVTGVGVNLPLITQVGDSPEDGLDLDDE
jgi:hypothetical protein